jgi:hypothetical protein
MELSLDSAKYVCANESENGCWYQLGRLRRQFVRRISCFAGIAHRVRTVHVRSPRRTHLKSDDFPPSPALSLPASDDEFWFGSTGSDEGPIFVDASHCGFLVPFEREEKDLPNPAEFDPNPAEFDPNPAPAPPTIEASGDFSFDNSFPIITIFLSSSIEIFDEFCFNVCGSLVSLAFDAGSKLSLIADYAFHPCESLRSILIPSSVRKLGEDCFDGCSHLSLVTFEGGSQLTEIGQSAFLHNRSLTLISIPSSVTLLCSNCFLGCEALDTVTFEPGSKLQVVEDDAFNRTALRSIRLPASISLLTGNSFPFFDLEEVSIEPGNEGLTNADGFLIASNALISYVGRDLELTIPNTIEYLTGSCFRRHPTVTNIKFESGSRIPRLPKEAFWRCQLLQSICIAASVVKIRKFCFNSCQRLVSVTFEPGSKLARIGKNAFTGCWSLPSITIPASVEVLYASCFLGCLRLASVNFEPGAKLSRIEIEAFKECQSLPLVCIPATVTKIGRLAFAGCCRLTAVTYEGEAENVDIGKDSFHGCPIGGTPATGPLTVEFVQFD